MLNIYLVRERQLTVKTELSPAGRESSLAEFVIPLSPRL